MFDFWQKNVVEAKIVKLLERLKSNMTYKQKINKDELNNLFDEQFKKDKCKGKSKQLESL